MWVSEAALSAGSPTGSQRSAEAWRSSCAFLPAAPVQETRTSLVVAESALSWICALAVSAAQQSIETEITQNRIVGLSYSEVGRTGAGEIRGCGPGRPVTSRQLFRKSEKLAGGTACRTIVNRSTNG